MNNKVIVCYTQPFDYKQKVELYEDGNLIKKESYTIDNLPEGILLSAFINNCNYIKIADDFFNLVPKVKELKNNKYQHHELIIEKL